MSGHIYKDCNGGRLLSSLSATWFVSYLYYLSIDSTHLNWTKFKKEFRLLLGQRSTTKNGLKKS